MRSSTWCNPADEREEQDATAVSAYEKTCPARVEIT